MELNSSIYYRTLQNSICLCSTREPRALVEQTIDNPTVIPYRSSCITVITAAAALPTGL